MSLSARKLLLQINGIALILASTVAFFALDILVNLFWKGAGAFYFRGTGICRNRFFRGARARFYTWSPSFSCGTETILAYYRRCDSHFIRNCEYSYVGNFYRCEQFTYGLRNYGDALDFCIFSIACRLPF
ncbi:Hypothetical protein LBL_2542 [Leptospira borgpetersenii serovar Hardjo-bovis str. L550]|uniref:Uncharacterized protein n=1 Tax=Leptospira borgpetersenii serovar Hardjo-bovis (strain JB197) TaxID=355277 RepID=Q04V38_LEPBJ|nr:Hypothetical protein LBJ_0537 [Leptospira borgpetersenii serovar Hardjo-bovis str. JB197]ABJ79906.1 Hypothetical protein LBL_2542 [Leptospira borgpetersenii serovar Hardjo-bovis str. L550]